MGNRLEQYTAHELLRIASKQLYQEGFHGIAGTITNLASSIEDKERAPDALPRRLPLRFLYDHLKEEYAELGEAYRVLQETIDNDEELGVLRSRVNQLEEDLQKVYGKLKKKSASNIELHKENQALLKGAALKEKNQTINRLKNKNGELITELLSLKRQFKKLQENG